MITWWWLDGRSLNIFGFIVKTFRHSHEFSANTSGYNYFWHQNDDYTLTSKNYIWSYPGKSYTKNAIIVMPEWNTPNWDTLKVTNCHGVCSDYVGKLK